MFITSDVNAKDVSRSIDGAQLTTCSEWSREAACSEHGLEYECASAVECSGQKASTHAQSSLLHEFKDVSLNNCQEAMHYLTSQILATNQIPKLAQIDYGVFIFICFFYFFFIYNIQGNWFFILSPVQSATLVEPHPLLEAPQTILKTEEWTY